MKDDLFDSNSVAKGADYPERQQQKHACEVEEEVPDELIHKRCHLRIGISKPGKHFFDQQKVVFFWISPYLGQQ